MADQLLDEQPSGNLGSLEKPIREEGSSQERPLVLSFDRADSASVARQKQKELNGVRRELTKVSTFQQASLPITNAEANSNDFGDSAPNSFESQKSEEETADEPWPTQEFDNALGGLDPQNNRLIQRFSKVIHRKRNIRTLVETYKQNLPNVRNLPAYYQAVDNLLIHAPEQVADISAIVLKQLDSSDPYVKDAALYALPRLLNTPDVDVKSLTMERLRIELRKSGLPAGELFEAWDATRSKVDKKFEDKNFGVYSENILKIADLENAKPGENICKTLYEEFGIKDFARYPTDLLIKQFEEKDITDIPYGILVYPKDDWNQAYYSDTDMLEGLFDQVKSVYALRVYESSSKRGLVHTLNASRKKYGKITFAMISGHGDKEGLDMEESEEGSIMIADIEKIGAKALSLAFEENPTIILSSCTVGEINGFAQVLSLLGAEVIASKGAGSTKNIAVSYDDNDKPHFNVSYNKRRYNRRYLNGSLIRN